MTEENIDVARDLVVYLLVRTDLPSMNAGKAMAQVHHAGVQMAFHCKESSMFLDYLDDGAKGNANGFNTTLSLAATLDDINIIRDRAANVGSNWPPAERVNIEFGTVVDPSYPFTVDTEIASLLMDNPKIAFVKHLNNGLSLFTRSEVTCAWFLGDRNDQRFTDLFKSLNLHP